MMLITAIAVTALNQAFYSQQETGMKTVDSLVEIKADVPKLFQNQEKMQQREEMPTGDFQVVKVAA